MRAGKPNQISRARRPNDPLRVLGITWRPVSLYKAVVFSTTVVICFLLLFARVIPSRLELEVGRVTPREVRATRTVTFEDTEETERLRTIERQATPPIVKPIRGARQEALQDLDGIFDAVRTVRANASLTTLTARLQEARQQIVVSLSDNTLRALLRATDEVLTDLQDRTRRILDLHLTKDEIRNDLADRILESRNAIAEEVGTSNISRVYQPVVTELAQQALRPNQEIDQQATERAQETAASRVDPATRTVEEGTPFIRRGDVVAKWQYDAAVQLGLITPSLDYLQILSLFVALLAVLVTLGLYIRTRLAEVYADARRLAVVGGALIVFLLAVRLAAEYGLMVAAAPAAAAFGALVLVILFDLELAFVAAIAMALLGGIAVVGNDPRAIILSALGAFVAALIGTLTTRRAQMVVRAAIAVAAANCAILLITNDVFGFTSEPRQVFYAFIGGLVAGVLAVATLPPLERLLDITTDVRLLELSSPNTPILRQMMSDAPGTYHSSILLANWCETAAEAIGANPLLARVGAYYHDIGKLEKPFYFVENQFGGGNPHDRLEPVLSARIIARHTKDGYRLAKQLGLPDRVCDMTRMHHGTTLIRFFYHKAREQAGNPDAVDISLFRHVGVKPRFKEAAILMVADSVEAAARTMTDPSPSKVEQLVDSIIQQRLDDGQFDECPITLNDLRLIKDTLVRILNGMFHKRIEYPQEPTEQEQRPSADRHGR